MASSGRGKRRACRVLIADGDRQSRELLMAALAEAGCRVEGVANGTEALLRVGKGDVDVLIADAHLPGLPAWVLFPRVHRAHPDVSFIAVADDGSWETARRVRTAGVPVFYYGLKPLDMGEMQQVVRSIAQWQRRRGLLSAIGRSPKMTR